MCRYYLISLTWAFQLTELLLFFQMVFFISSQILRVGLISKVIKDALSPIFLLFANSFFFLRRRRFDRSHIIVCGRRGSRASTGRLWCSDNVGSPWRGGGHTGHHSLISLDYIKPICGHWTKASCDVLTTLNRGGHRLLVRVTNLWLQGYKSTHSIRKSPRMLRQIWISVEGSWTNRSPYFGTRVFILL